MNKFFSNDRQVILKSAATGVGVISLLCGILLLNTDSIILWIIATCGLLAVYWFIPTWFSRNRPVEKREIKHFIPEGIEMNKPATPEYQYFNADGEAIKKLSDIERIVVFILFCAISTFLVFFAYDIPVKFLLAHYPYAKTAVIYSTTILSFSTPYLIRHIYCFVMNCPMDTSLTLHWTNKAYIHKYNNNSSRNTATNPSYSYLSYNVNHRR